MFVTGDSLFRVPQSALQKGPQQLGWLQRGEPRTGSRRSLFTTLFKHRNQDVPQHVHVPGLFRYEIPLFRYVVSSNLKKKKK